MLALVLALVAIGVSSWTLWFEHLRRFGVACVPEAVLIVPAPEGRDDSVFGVTVAMALRNTGVRAGVIDGAYVRLTGPAEVEFRLDALFVGALAQPIVESSRGAEVPEMVEGMGGFIPLGSRETRAVSLRFSFPPADAKRWDWYGRPKERFVEGSYEFEVWFRWGSDDWARFSAGAHELSAARMGHLPFWLLTGDKYDRAPGGPAAHGK